MNCSDQIISTLQTSAQALLRERFVEIWAYSSGNKPVSITVKHTISPADAGGFRLHTTLSFALRLAYSQNADLAPQQDSKPAFPRSVSTLAAA